MMFDGLRDEICWFIYFEWEEEENKRPEKRQIEKEERLKGHLMIYIHVPGTLISILITHFIINLRIQIFTISLHILLWLNN